MKKKIIGLDLGQAWIGIAVSDKSALIARPYETVSRKLFSVTLAVLIKKEDIDTIVVGHPITMQGKKSEQTLLIESEVTQLKNLYPEINWILWDERLSSKRATLHKRSSDNSVKNRHFIHSIAASYILDSYLTFLHAQQALLK